MNKHQRRLSRQVKHYIRMYGMIKNYRVMKRWYKKYVLNSLKISGYTASVHIFDQIHPAPYAIYGIPKGEYTEMEYIENSGTRYIDTGVMVEGQL